MVSQGRTKMLSDACDPDSNPSTTPKSNSTRGNSSAVYLCQCLSEWEKLVRIVKSLMYRQLTVQTCRKIKMKLEQDT